MFLQKLSPVVEGQMVFWIGNIMLASQEYADSVLCSQPIRGN